MLALGDQVLASEVGLGLTFGRDRRDDDLALALGVLAHRNLAVDLADDGVIFRLAGFEELGDAGQTAGDVLHLGRVARDLRENLAGVDEVAFLRHDVRADGEQVASIEVVGSRDLLGLAGVCGSLIEMRGRRSAARDSMTTLRERPVTSSSFSVMVTPSTRSPNFA